ncbi:MAG: hypothetical protein IJ880_12510, partial [Bacilli bacterium]|nr:hypothetical protein [Bacilli bacterium]
WLFFCLLVTNNAHIKYADSEPNQAHCHFTHYRLFLSAFRFTSFSYSASAAKLMSAFTTMSMHNVNKEIAINTTK